MKKLFLLIFLIPFFLAPKAEAKVWTKDLVDKVTLESGYHLSLCGIDLEYSHEGQSDDRISDQEAKFLEDPDRYACDGENDQGILFANLTLHFNSNWNADSTPEKLMPIGDKLYSVGGYSYFGPDPEKSTISKDISSDDWLSTLPGIRGIRGDTLIDTSPKTTYDEKGLPDTNFILLYDDEGKFKNGIFVIDGKVYKLDKVISKTSEPVTLVDYTVNGDMESIPSPSSEPGSSVSPTPSPSPSITHIEPAYVPEKYYELGKKHFEVSGVGFQKDAKVFLEGDYSLEGNPDRLEPDPNSNINTYELTNVVYTDNRYEGDLPAGLPNGYFKVKIVNPNGSTIYTQGAMAILRGGDPNEK